MKSRTSDDAIRFFQRKIVAQFGLPIVVLSENGPAFSAMAWKNALEGVKAETKTVVPYSSQANGGAETVFRTVGRASPRKEVEDRWKKQL